MKLSARWIALPCDAYNTTPDELRNVLGQIARRTSDTHEERYTHFREMPPDSKYRAITVFSRKEGDNWFHTYAKCLKGDQFSRSMGRKIARRHYFANRFTDHVTFSPEFDYHALAAAVGAIVPEQTPQQQFEEGLEQQAA